MNDKKIMMTDTNIAEKVSVILESMTLEQKIGQMVQAECLTCTPEDVKKYHLGSIMSGAGANPDINHVDQWIDRADSYWQASMDDNINKTAIPIMYGVDAIHGHSNILHATIFPHNIGLGAANDVDLVEKIARATAKEVLATGVDWVFAPNLAVATDYRWGRTYESFSADPKLVAEYAAQIIPALQQVDEKQQLGVIACAKHFVGDGGACFGISHGNTELSFSELSQQHIYPFFQAIDADVMSIMVSFSSWNGEKCHGHQFLISDILKKEMQFNGIVISDMEGIDYLSSDYYSAIASGVNAGIDMFMIPEKWHEFIDHLISHVQFGSVSIDRINDAVTRILTVKFKAGIFDLPKPSKRLGVAQYNLAPKEHLLLAREAVSKSLVLLKNDDQILPLKPDNKILVTGSNADNIGHQCGGFTLDWQGVSGNQDFVNGQSIFQAIAQESQNAVYISPENLFTKEEIVQDLAIVVIGEKPYAEGVGDIRSNDNIIIETGSMVNGEINILEPYGSSLELNQLHPEDLKLLTFLAEKNIPTVVILISGRPLIINKELALSTAFVAAWLPGSQGYGISDVLFGHTNFTGKLPFSWPETISNNSRNTITKNPLFPQGFGLKMDLSKKI